MAWTATLKDIQRGETSWALYIVYSNGAQTIPKQYTAQTVSDASVEALARNEIAGFDQVAASLGKVSYKVGDSIDLAPPVAPPPASKPADPVPSAAEIAFIQFKTDYLAWQRATRGVAAGLVKQADADALLATVQSEYLPEYADIL